MPEIQCMEQNKTTTKTFTFHPITLEAKELIESYTKPWKAECSDLSFANMFIWGDGGKMEYAEQDNFLFIKLDFKTVPVYFWAPIPKFGEHVDYRGAVCSAITYMKGIGVEPTFRSVSTPFLEMMQENCPELHAMPTEIAWDYVYEQEKMATLKGKKLHGKRNHINKFLSLHPDYVYKKLDKTMIQDCVGLYDQWIGEKDEPSIALFEERSSVLLALNNMEALGLIGGAIYLDEKLVAFTVGERLHSHIQLIHIEKADAEIDGLYPMINQQYVLHECTDVELINREEDMGIAGMRKAKRAYYPVKMVEKYLIGTRDLTGVKGIWGSEEENLEV